MPQPSGKIILLNGAPRSGKSSIAAAIQAMSSDLWVNLGVDNAMKTVPQQFQPAIGLRPGGERPDLEPMIETLYLALYESIAAHSRRGINVVADLGHHDHYSRPLNILPRCARILRGLPALIAGVHCPIGEIMRRREATWGQTRDEFDRIPAPILRWQETVHKPGIYDLEVDTFQLTPEQCAAKILARFEEDTPLQAVETLAKHS